MPPKDVSDWRRLLGVETPMAPVSRLEAGAARVPCLTVLAHPAVEWVGARAVLRELEARREVPLSRLEPRFLAPGSGAARPLADPFVSRQPILLEPWRDGGVRLRRGESRTPLAVDGEPVAARRDLARADLERGAVLLLAHRVALCLHLSPAAPAAPIAPRPAFGLVGESAAIQRLRQDILRAATADVPVLLRGATGTGKELVARAIHDAGPRRDRPYVAVNLAAVPPTLAASELFGAARGAFTGATERQPGHFARAASGTLFLDEIGDAPAEVQVLLLRALESHEIQTVGGGAPRAVDVRVIAATDADLATRIEAGAFRAPLYHRLSGLEIALPSLAERREDVGLLLVHFLRRELAALGRERLLDEPPAGAEPWLPAELVARLAAADWPGNVRQLRNVARQLAVGSAEAPRAVLEGVGGGGAAPEPAAEPSKRPARRLGIDDATLLAALRDSGWEIKAAARRLGVSRAVLYDFIERSPEVRKAADLGAEEIEGCRRRHGGDVAAMAAELKVSRDGLRQRMRALGLP